MGKLERVRSAQVGWISRTHLSLPVLSLELLRYKRKREYMGKKPKINTKWTKQYINLIKGESMTKQQFIEEKVKEFKDLIFSKNNGGREFKVGELSGSDRMESFLRSSIEEAWRKGELEILHSEGLAQDEV